MCAISFVVNWRYLIEISFCENVLCLGRIVGQKTGRRKKLAVNVNRLVKHTKKEEMWPFFGYF